MIKCFSSNISPNFMVFKDLLQASEKKTWKHDHRLESFDPNVKVILEEYFQMSSLHVFYAIFEQ